MTITRCKVITTDHEREILLLRYAGILEVALIRFEPAVYKLPPVKAVASFYHHNFYVGTLGRFMGKYLFVAIELTR